MNLLVAKLYLLAYTLIEKATVWRERRTGWASVPIPVHALRSGPVTIDVIHSGCDHDHPLSSMPIQWEEPQTRGRSVELVVLDEPPADIEAWFREQFGGEGTDAAAS